jgi:nucleotide-binding universal stress UspA family protein
VFIMKLVIALDHSDRDRLVLEACKRFASSSSPELQLIHVISLPKSLIPNAAREEEAYLRAVQASLQEEGIVADTTVRKGDVAHEIGRLADECEADAVLIGTHGRRGWERVALGSVAEAVLTSCPRPVLIVNEATYRAHLSDDIRRKSSYLASVVWAKQARGEISAQQAGLDLERFAEAGLDRNTLLATYRVLMSEGISPDWFDIGFQLTTLQEYLPSEVAAAPGPAGAALEESAA